LDLPAPFGPTTQVIPGSKRSVVADANDLNPRSVTDLRCTTCSPGRGRYRGDRAGGGSCRGGEDHRRLYRPASPDAGKRAVPPRPHLAAHVETEPATAGPR
jgi:hypothetical protein